MFASVCFSLLCHSAFFLKPYFHRFDCCVVFHHQLLSYFISLLPK